MLSVSYNLSPSLVISSIKEPFLKKGKPVLFISPKSLKDQSCISRPPSTHTDTTIQPSITFISYHTGRPPRPLLSNHTAIHRRIPFYLFRIHTSDTHWIHTDTSNTFWRPTCKACIQVNLFLVVHSGFAYCSY